MGIVDLKDSIAVVVFDLGNVVVKFDHNISAFKIARRYGLDQKKVYDLFFDSNIVKRLDEGSIEPRRFHQKIKQYLNIDIGFEDFKDIWNDIFYVNKPIVPLIKKIKKRYRIFLMSNTNSLHFNYIRKKFKIIDVFDKVILSYKVKKRKPHLKIYKYMINLASVSPEKIVYIDDRPELIEGASKLGIKGIVFKDVISLKKELRMFKVYF